LRLPDPSGPRDNIAGIPITNERRAPVRQSHSFGGVDVVDLLARTGAYYTWLNQQRLSEAEKASFLIWFEGHSEALAIGPAMDRGAESDQRLSLAQILNKLV
jgi:hypothetical protein